MSLNINVLGASGHVGQRVVRYLLSQDSDVVGTVGTVNRRVLADGTFPDDPRLREHVVDMSSGEALAAACGPILQGVDVIVATMGIGSGKGSVEEFRKVDVELPSAFAAAAVSAGVGRAVLLTSVGANVEKKTSLLSIGHAEGQYFHLKGVVEKSFSDAGFPGGVAVFRPAGLLGTSYVPGFLDWLLPALDWVAPARFQSIHIDRLAEAIARTALNNQDTAEQDLVIFQGSDIFDLLSEKRSRAGFGSA